MLHLHNRHSHVFELERFGPYLASDGRPDRRCQFRVKPMPFMLALRPLSRCLCLAILAVALPLLAQARTAAEEALACDQAAQQAADQTGVPLDVLLAISRVETGRTVDGQLAPWPWSVNQAGDGTWFDTRTAAEFAVSEALSTGATNIDIGCFQLNYHWHGQEFASITDMFDPVQNALYAAGYLLRLQSEHGGWDGAIGAYHSKRAEAAEAYLARVTQIMGLSPDLATDQIADASPPLRENRYPLLRGGTVRHLGSLVATDPDAQPVPLLR